MNRTQPGTVLGPAAHTGRRRLRTQQGAAAPPAVPRDPLERIADLILEGNKELVLIKAAIIGPVAPSDVDQGIPVGYIRSVRVLTPGTPVRGPDREVPEGYDMVVRQRNHPGSPTGYFGFGEGDTDAELTRSEMRDGDSLSLSTTRVQNLKNLLFDADTADTYFELIVLT